MTAILAAERPLAEGAAAQSRSPRLAGFAASLALHAAVLAAALAGLAGETAKTGPEPLLVELVVALDAGAEAFADGTSGSDGGATRAIADVSASADVPAPPAVTPSTPSRQPPRRPSLETAKTPPAAKKRPRQEEAAETPRRLSAATPSSSTTAGDPMGASSAAPPGSEAAPASSGSGETIAASLETSAGAGAAGIGRRHGGGVESSGGGATSRPGFALGSAANPMPPYPPAARRRGIEGTVALRVLVSAEGRALSVEIARSSGAQALDEAARDAIGQWRFRPAMRGGEAIAAIAFIPGQFSLLEP